VKRNDNPLLSDHFKKCKHEKLSFGISHKRPKYVQGSELNKFSRSTTMLSNSSSILKVYEHISKKYDTLWAKRIYVSQFVGLGMEEGEFSEAREEW